tara:strand:- start:1311 stop:1475 length:165 start_codon:yes stop_codon:yes gene_type:complete
MKSKELMGYYWDGKDSFVIEKQENGSTKIIKEEFRNLDHQVEEARKMQKECYNR